MDSTGVWELVMFVEETFGITVQDEEIVPQNFDSVSQLAADAGLGVCEGMWDDPGGNPLQEPYGSDYSQIDHVRIEVQEAGGER